MTTTKPMPEHTRRAIYLLGRSELTPAQRRRLRKKANQAEGRASR